MSVLEVEEKLNNASVIIKNQGYVLLLKALHSLDNISSKSKEEWIKLYFDTFGSFGRIVCGWSQASISKLVVKGVFSSERAVSECLLQLDRDSCYISKTIGVVIRLAPLQLHRLSYVILRKEKFTEEVINELSIDKSRGSSILTSLYFCSLLTKPERILLSEGLVSNIPPHLLINSNASATGWSADIFEEAVNLYYRPDDLLDSRLPCHHLLIPVVLSVFTVWGELEKSCPGLIGSPALQQCRTFLAGCLKVDKSVGNFTTSDVQRNLMDTFNAVRSERESDRFFTSWNHLLGCEGSSVVCVDSSLLFACGLLPCCSAESKERAFDLLTMLCSRNSSLTHLLFPLFMILYTKPYFPIDKSVVLQYMMKIVNRTIVHQVVKFFCIVSQQKSGESSLASQFLGDLVVRFPTICDELLPLVKIGDADSDNEVERKLGLVRKMFEATDSAEDDLLPMVSSLLKKNGHRLSLAVNLVTYLVAEEVLDLPAVRRQLAKTVKLPGNETALVQYCYTLGVGGRLKYEEGSQDPRPDCISELWELTQHQCNSSAGLIAKAAWESLTNFSSTELAECLTSIWDNLLPRCISMNELECEGFSKFLNHMLCSDVETLPRPLYTKKYEKDDSVLANAYVWFDALSRTNDESPWLWRASLELFPAISRTTPPLRRYAASTKLFRRLISEVTVDVTIDLENSVLLLSSWKNSVYEALVLLAETKNDDFIWARDQICDECQRALRQNEHSLPNVVMILTALASIMENMASKTDCPSRRQVLESSTKAWLSSVVSFVIPIPITSGEDLKPLSPPLFTVIINEGCCPIAVSQLCDYILYGLQKVFFDANNILSLVGNSVDILSENEYSKQVHKLIVDNINCFPSRTGLLTTASAFGLETINISSLESRMKDNSATLCFVQTTLNRDREITGDDIDQLILSFAELSSRSRVILETNIRRYLERRWTISNEFKRSIYEGVGKYCTAHWNNSRDCLPLKYDALPETSILRKVVTFISKEQLSDIQLNSLIASLTPLKRSDDRSLPAFDWYDLLCDKMESNCANLRLSILRLACQESSFKLINGIISSSSLSSSDESAEVVQHFELMLRSLPQKEHYVFIDHIVAFGLSNVEERSKVVRALSSVQQQTSVFRYLKEHLPLFDESGFDILINNIFLDVVSDGDTFRNVISRSFNVWLECNKTTKSDMVYLLKELEEATLEERGWIYRIIGLASTGRGEAYVVTSMLNLISVHNISHQNGVFKPLLFELFVVLLCCLRSPVPLSWTGTEDVLHQCYATYRRFLVSWCSKEKPEILKIVRRFLLSHLVPEEDSRKIDIIRDIVLLISSQHLFSATELLELGEGVVDILFRF